MKATEIGQKSLNTACSVNTIKSHCRPRCGHSKIQVIEILAGIQVIQILFAEKRRFCTTSDGNPLAPAPDKAMLETCRSAASALFVWIAH